jgi:hypothetical protein
MDALNFIKSNFAPMKVTNVHVQTENIIFDIPEEKLADWTNTLSSETITKSPYEVKEATSKDREMTSLKQLARSGNYSGGDSRRPFQERGETRRPRNF